MGVRRRRRRPHSEDVVPRSSPSGPVPAGSPARPEPVPLVVSRDAGLIESVLAAAASVGVAPVVAADEADVPRRWRGASCVVVGADLAALVASMRLPRRPGVHLAGDDRDELLSWSVPLDASVVVLPDQRALLASVVDPRFDDGVGQGRVVRLVGGSGGVGTSTVAAGLAQVAAQRRLPSALVELDPGGGGIDLLVGAESAPGWRWSDLRAASGRIESLAGHLPNVSGVDVLAMSRPVPEAVPSRMRRAEGPRPAPAVTGSVSPDAARSVVAALTRSHRLIVVDAGRGHSAVGDQWPGSTTLLVVAASARGVAAAASRLACGDAPDASLVVRVGTARSIGADAVGRLLSRPVVGVVHDDRRLPAAAATGDPPGRARGRFRREMEQLLTRVVGDD